MPRRPVVVLTSYRSPLNTAAIQLPPPPPPLDHSPPLLKAINATHRDRRRRRATDRSAAVDAPATKSRAPSKHIARQSTVLVYYCYNKVVEAAATTTASGHGGTYMYNVSSNYVNIYYIVYIEYNILLYILYIG